MYLFLEEKGRRKEGEKHQCVFHIGGLTHAPDWGPDLACNPGLCPDWESDW